MRLRIILAFHIALIYYTQDFRVYEGTRDQPMPGPFPAPPIFEGKSPKDEVGAPRLLRANRLPEKREKAIHIVLDRERSSFFPQSLARWAKG